MKVLGVGEQFCSPVYTFVFLCLNLFVFHIVHLHGSKFKKYPKIYKERSTPILALHSQFHSYEEAHVITLWWIHSKVCHAYTQKYRYDPPLIYKWQHEVHFTCSYMRFLLHSISCISFHINKTVQYSILFNPTNRN